MTLAAVKEKLHDYIEHADARQANAMLSLFENELSAQEYVLDEETMNMLNERLERYLSGESKGYTLEESMERVKKHRIKDGL